MYQVIKKRFDDYKLSSDYLKDYYQSTKKGDKIQESSKTVFIHGESWSCLYSKFMFLIK